MRDGSHPGNFDIVDLRINLIQCLTLARPGQRGFGTGKLRKAVEGLLNGHPHVSKFHPADPSHGGGGVTVVELKE